MAQNATIEVVRVLRHGRGTAPDALRAFEFDDGTVLFRWFSRTAKRPLGGARMVVAQDNEVLYDTQEGVDRLNEAHRYVDQMEAQGPYQDEGHPQGLPMEPMSEEYYQGALSFLA